MLDGFQLLTFAHNSLSSYRGDQAETTKQCELANRISDKVLKRKSLITRGGQQKRFRGPSQTFQPVPRAFTPMMMQPCWFSNPQMMQSMQGMPFQQFPQTYQGFQLYPRQQQQQQQQQGFTGSPRRKRFQRGQRFQGPQKRGAMK